MGKGGREVGGAGAPAVEGRGAASASASDSARGSGSDRGSARNSARLSSATTRGEAGVAWLTRRRLAAGDWRLATYATSRPRLAGPAQYVYELSSGSL